MKKQKGITLIALVITIIVLLILAVVAIREVTGNGIIAHAKNAREEHQKAADKEEILLALNEWKIEGATTNKIFEAFMKEKFGTDKVTANGDELTITLKNGNQYQVNPDGIITPIEKPVAGIEITKNVNLFSTGNSLIRATLVGIEGDITWELDDEESGFELRPASDGKRARISDPDGLGGQVTVIARCGEYKAECTVRSFNGEDGKRVAYDCFTGASQLEYRSQKENNGYGEQIFKLTEDEGKIEWNVLRYNSDGDLLIIPSKRFWPCRSRNWFYY